MVAQRGRRTGLIALLRLAFRSSDRIDDPDAVLRKEDLRFGGYVTREDLDREYEALRR